MSGTAANGLCQGEPARGGRGGAVAGGLGTVPPVFSADLNECEVYKRDEGPRLCAHLCVNLPGSYRCACPPGYQLLGDGKSCEGEERPRTCSRHPFF